MGWIIHEMQMKREQIPLQMLGAGNIHWSCIWQTSTGWMMGENRGGKKCARIKCRLLGRYSSESREASNRNADCMEFQWTNTYATGVLCDNCISMVTVILGWVRAGHTTSSYFFASFHRGWWDVRIGIINHRSGLCVHSVLTRMAYHRGNRIQTTTMTENRSFHHGDTSTSIATAIPITSNTVLISPYKATDNKYPNLKLQGWHFPYCR